MFLDYKQFYPSNKNFLSNLAPKSEYFLITLLSLVGLGLTGFLLGSNYLEGRKELNSLKISSWFQSTPKTKIWKSTSWNLVGLGVTSVGLWIMGVEMMKFHHDAGTKPEELDIKGPIMCINASNTHFGNVELKGSHYSKDETQSTMESLRHLNLSSGIKSAITDFSKELKLSGIMTSIATLKSKIGPSLKYLVQGLKSCLTSIYWVKAKIHHWGCKVSLTYSKTLQKWYGLKLLIGGKFKKCSNYINSLGLSKTPEFLIRCKDWFSNLSLGSKLEFLMIIGTPIYCLITCIRSCFVNQDEVRAKRETAQEKTRMEREIDKERAQELAERKRILELIEREAAQERAQFERAIKREIAQEIAEKKRILELIEREAAQERAQFERASERERARIAERESALERAERERA